MTQDDFIYLFAERMAIMMENGRDEAQATAQATQEVRQIMVEMGMDFLKANMKVMGIRKLVISQKNDKN